MANTKSEKFDWSEEKFQRLEQRWLDDLAKNNFSSDAYQKVYDESHNFLLKTNRVDDSRLCGTSKLYKISPFITKMYIQRFIGTNKRVLEVAFGDGFLSIYLAKKGDIVSAIDISKICLELARWNVRKFNVDVDLKLGDGRKLDFEDNYFDFVVSTEFIEHITKDGFLGHLDEVRRVLKSRGCYIFVTPNSYAYSFGKDRLHLKKYTYGEIKSILDGKGFDAKTFPFSILPVKQPLFGLGYKIRLENLFHKLKLPVFLWDFFTLNKVVVVARKR